MLCRYCPPLRLKSLLAIRKNDKIKPGYLIPPAALFPVCIEPVPRHTGNADVEQVFVSVKKPVQRVLTIGPLAP